ncbi:hypothetical protein DAPPUDRAFT_304858 [Daphnia pulex]|uniref:Uncharacterized protein n=1 Tax=Daphnia pulex TaxID=6669 RepID=E9GM96_DAPPU|nr:hypothetical protein DAPPUDRAFT_304858 [Daphnia pulex]|eukprot:EFX79327.1 hypothetical protein DAPPUDRAFT_304858 [Daphnia pulex]
MTFPEAADRTERSYRLTCMLSCDKVVASLFLRNRKKGNPNFSQQQHNNAGRPTVAHGQLSYQHAWVNSLRRWLSPCSHESSPRASTEFFGVKCCNMGQTFLLWALCFSSCLLCAVAQESKSTISLEASGYVHNGSTVHYDAAAAQLELQLKMLIHPLSSKGKSHQRGNDYRVELALVDGSKKMMNDQQFAACNLAFSRFAGYCKERHIFTPIYQNSSHNHTNDVTVQFDHVYSGCYKLKINRCSHGRFTCDSNKSGVFEQYLGYLETSIQDVNVRRMNMSISLHPSPGGVEVEFVVNYLENPHQILKFNEFEVKIKNQFNHAVSKRIVNSNVVNFLNCTEIDANCSLSSSENSDNKCFCLPIGNYTVEVYDAGDPEQQEDVIIRGEIHWFNGYINDPEVRIIVIQSTGLNRCHEELNRDRHNGPLQQDLDKLSSLMFVLSELIVLAASIRENGLYGRIFVISYDDLKCSSPRNLLTPYRCYELPEHYPMMMGQLFVNRSIKMG